MYDQYKAEGHPDEILRFTGVRLLANGGMQFTMRGLWEPSQECHHIFGGQGRRLDRLSNLIAVNSAGHHERHHGTKGLQNEFTTLCLISKWLKSIRIGEYLEFHHDDLREAAGRNILPIIESVTFPDEWLENERRKLESLIRTLESD